MPGCVSGWQALSERFGRLGLARLLAPSIEYARAGFPVSPIIASHFAGWRDEDNPHLAPVFHPGGRVPGYGDVFQNPLLAASYERIAKDGRPPSTRARPPSASSPSRGTSAAT